MPTRPERILQLLRGHPGLTDQEITDILMGPGAGQQCVNQACRALADRGVISRRAHADGIIGNYLMTEQSDSGSRPSVRPDSGRDDLFCEDPLKQRLQRRLEVRGWHIKAAYGKVRGVDLEAVRGNERWVIGVKGRGSRNAMRVNYFLAALRKTLQRMDDAEARYSIALPDLEQFRLLWQRLPQLAKSRTGITALFVDDRGTVSEVD